MGALNTYITQCRRLLHDANGQFWPDAELTDYINEARNRVAQDTKCLRQLVTGLTLTVGQDAYTVQTFIPTIGSSVIDVMGITVYWGQTRVKLGYMPWTQFDAYMRYWVNMQRVPQAYSRISATTVYIGPPPDQAYVTDWEVAINPNALVSDSTTEQIPQPFQDPVKYYAASLAKFKEQSLGEVQIYEAKYKKVLLECARSFMTRTIADPYAR